MKKYIFYLSAVFLLISYQVIARTQNNLRPNALEPRFIPRLNQSVTFLGLGGIELGRDWGIDESGRKFPKEETAKKTLEMAVNLKISVIDTASSYQLSEERISRYASPTKKNYLLITKAGEHSVMATDSNCEKPYSTSPFCEKPKSVYDFSRTAIRKDVENSLKIFNVKEIDVVLLHLNNKDADKVIQKGEAVATLKELQQEGKVRYIGISINGEVAKRCIESNMFDVIELEYNLLNTTNAENIKLAHDKGMAVIVRGGLGTGLLTSQVKNYIDDKKFPYKDQVKTLLKLTHYNYNKLTQLALAFLYQNKNISSVIIGVNNPKHLISNISLLNNFNDYKLLGQAKEAMKKFKTPEEYTEVMGEYYEN